MRVVALAAQRERRGHVHHRAHALALAAHRGELERPLLELLEVHRHLEAAEPERHLDLGAPVRVVDDLEALDAGHQAGHPGGVADDRPDALARRVELLRALDLHALSTFTSARVAAGSRRIEKTRW